MVDSASRLVTIYVAHSTVGSLRTVCLLIKEEHQSIAELLVNAGQRRLKAEKKNA